MERKEWLAALPKVELHCHLDGSLPPEAMTDYLTRTGRLPAGQTLRYSVPADCTSLADYLTCFDLPLLCLQTEDSIADFVRAVLRDAAREGIYYLELRFAPAFSQAEGLGLEQVFAAVRRGRETGTAETGVRCGFLACAMRNLSPAQNLEMLEEAARCYPDLIWGLDLAGDEAAHPTWKQEAVFRRARELGIPFTIHSGETGSVENLEAALSYGAARVGHGIALQKSSELLRAYAEAGIGVELCPLSNLQTRAVSGWDTYPFRRFREAGLTVTVNTDNRTVSGTTLTEELERLCLHCGLTPAEVPELLLNANRCSFAPPRMKADYEAALQAFLLKNPTGEVTNP
ncbi:MAG: adenosine deaminase [Clostridiales bacterium]|nr:adenosine deaminase [Clostridiales bacterium]